MGNDLGAWDDESVGQIVPNEILSLAHVFGEAEEGVATVPAEITACAAAELAPGDVTTNSFSDPLVCSGISGRSSTISNSDLLA